MQIYSKKSGFCCKLKGKFGKNGKICHTLPFGIPWHLSRYFGMQKMAGIPVFRDPGIYRWEPYSKSICTCSFLCWKLWVGQCFFAWTLWNCWLSRRAQSGRRMTKEPPGVLARSPCLSLPWTLKLKQSLWKKKLHEFHQIEGCSEASWIIRWIQNSQLETIALLFDGLNTGLGSLCSNSPPAILPT